jgi:hypothetical protein
VTPLQHAGRTFSLSSDQLNSVLAGATYWHFTNAHEITPQIFADVLTASGAGATSQIPPDLVRAVLRQALIGGGMDAQTAADVSQHILRNQQNREVEFLAARIVRAVIGDSHE